MRRLFTAVTLALSLPLLAQEPLKQDSTPRFAFFTLGQLVNESPKAKKIYSVLENSQKALSDKLKAKAEEGQKIQQLLQGTSLTDQGREQKAKELRDLQFEYKKLEEDSQADFSKVQQKVLGELYGVVGPIMNNLAKERHLQVVFSGESAQAGQLIQWADEAWFKSFTSEVAKRLEASDVKPSAVPAVAPTAKPGTTKPVVKKP